MSAEIRAPGGYSALRRVLADSSRAQRSAGSRVTGRMVLEVGGGLALFVGPGDVRTVRAVGALSTEEVG